MDLMKLDIQLFADGKVVIDTQLNTKNFENGLTKMQNTSKKAGSTIKNIVVGLGITKIISTAMSQITGSIDGAIKRLDTFQQYPKVLKNFGVSADEANQSIKRIDKSVQGLPTSLDQAVSGVQNLFMVTKDLGKAEKLFKAINDSAMVFANGSTEAVDRFAYAFKQAMASGKVSAQDFNQMNEAIPGIMDKVAESMGKTYAELKEGLSNGSISMEEFNKALVDLDTKGGAGMEALEKTAKTATGGIQTSMENAKTAIKRGMAEIIEAIDTQTEKLGMGKLTDVITKMGTDAEKGLKGIATLISGDTEKIITDNLKKLETTGPQMVNTITTKINENLPNIIDSAGNILTQFISTLNANLPQLIKSGIDIATTLIKSIGDQIPKLLPEVLETLMITFLELTKPENLNKIAEAGASLIISLIEGIINCIPKLIENTDFTLEAFLNIISGGQALVRKLGIALIKALIKGIINSIPELAEAGFKIIKSFIDKITSFISNVYNKGKEIVKKFINGIKEGGLNYIKEVGIQLINGLWQGIQNRWNSLKSKVEGLAKGIVDKFKSVFGIKSPSKVFRDEIGKYLAQGIDVGFEDEIENVYRKMQKAIDIETSKMTASVQTSGTYQIAMNSTPTFSLKDNSTNRTELVVDGRKLAEVVNTQNRNREVAKA